MMKPNGYESEGAFAMTSDPRALSMHLEPLTTLQLGSPAGQLCAAPVSLGEGQPKAILATYCADFDVDPYITCSSLPPTP